MFASKTSRIDTFIICLCQHYLPVVMVGLCAGHPLLLSGFQSRRSQEKVSCSPTKTVSARPLSFLQGEVLGCTGSDSNIDGYAATIPVQDFVIRIGTECKRHLSYKRGCTVLPVMLQLCANRV